MKYSEYMEEVIEKIKQEFPNMTFYENEPMSKHCSMKVGGPVRAIAVPSDIFSLSKITFILQDNYIAPFILGNGTNILIPDEGLNIFVISTEKLQKMWLADESKIYVDAGVSLSKVSQFAANNSLSGLEFASGIPGTVGGAVLMNAGAYGSEMKDIVESVVYYDLHDQALNEVLGSECDFSYRHSRFENESRIILGAMLSLEKSEKESVVAKMNELNEKRRTSQPLDKPSCGSAFKRPEKGYAAALIEESGLKGFSIGDAQVSDKHAGFIVNNGNATYDELYELISHVRNTVLEKSNIALEPEIKIYPKNMVLIDTYQEEAAAKAIRDNKEQIARQLAETGEE